MPERLQIIVVQYVTTTLDFVLHRGRRLLKICHGPMCNRDVSDR